MKALHYVTFLASMASLSACELQKEPTATTVEGTIINKYTRQPIANVPIEVRQWRYGAFGNTSIDFIAGTQTGADGHFSIAFDGNAKGVTYRVDFRGSRDLYDLTDYRPFDNYSASDGASLAVGKSNLVNFEATPFVPVQVVINANKRGGTVLQADYIADERDGQGFFHGIVVNDTARATQQVLLTRTIRVVPNRPYVFSLYRATVVQTGPYQYRNDNVSYEKFTRFVAYTDTTAVRLK